MVVVVVVVVVLVVVVLVVVAIYKFIGPKTDKTVTFRNYIESNKIKKKERYLIRQENTVYKFSIFFFFE